jgi:hypothetical protein
MVPHSPDDVLQPHTPVRLGDGELFVDTQRPVAALVTPGRATTFITWPDAALPPTAGPSEVLEAPNAAWVIYRELEAVENPGPFVSTAVRIGVDGSCRSIELGHLAPIGADDHGVWLTAQPAPVVDDDSDEDREAVKAQEEFFLKAKDAPLEEWDDLPEPVPRPIGIDFPATGDGVSFGWTADPDSSGRRGIGLEVDDSADDPAPRPPASTAADTGPVTLIRRGLAADVEMGVDRIVSEVAMVEGRLRLTYHPTGPIITPEPGGSSWSYEYPQETIDIDVSTGLPEQVRVADHPSTKVPTRECDDWLDDDDEPDATPVISLSGVPGTSWTLRVLDADRITASIEKVRSDLLGLDEPSLVWLDVDDTVHRVRSDYRELSVHVENDWPDTEVVAEFRYRRFGAQRVRYRVRLFDAAGRPILYEYLTVYLMEDLDTMDLDETEIAPDGFITLSAHLD